MKLFVFHPDSRTKELWDIFILILTVISAVVIPLQIALHVPFSTGLLYYEILISAAFGVDVLLHFFTGIKQENKIISDHRAIAKRYLATWFFPDLLAALPLFLLNQTEMAEAVALLRSLRILQVNRLIRLARLNTIFKDFYRRHAMNPGLFRLSFFLLVMALVTHFLACGWILIGGAKNSGGIVEKYIEALYFTVTTLASVGYGDIVPSSMFQRIYAMLLMMVGVGAYGFVIGNVASYLANRDVVRANYLAKLEEVTAFMKYRSITPNLRQQVFAYYNHLWESRMGQDEDSVLGDLPESLRVDIALSMRRDLIQTVPFFREAGEDLLRDIVMALRPCVYTPGAIIIRRGEMGDCMFIVSSGCLEVVSGDGKEVYAELNEGSFVGEMALVFQTERTATVRSRDYSDLYILSKRHFNMILRKHPSFAEHVKKIAEERRRDVESREAQS